MRTIVGWSLRHKSLAILAAVLLIAGGAFGATQLRQELLPDVSLPVFTVNTVVPGAGPEAVDENVTRPVETAVSGIEGLENVEGTSQQGISAVQIEFGYETDLDEAEAEVRSALDAVELPAQAVEPEVSRIASGDFPIQVISVSADDAETAREESNGGGNDEDLGGDSDNDLRGLTGYVQDEVVAGIEDVEGVSEVAVVGAADPMANVALDPDRLSENGVTAQGVLGAINGSEIQAPIGAGRVEGEQRSTPILAESELSDEAALESVGVLPGAASAPPSASASPQPVPLGDVADVSEQNSEGSGLARSDGAQSIALSVTREADSNTVEVAEAVDQELAGVRDDMGDAEQVRVVSDDAESVGESVNDLLLKGAIGLAAAVLVVVLFLRTWRATLVAAASIPVAIAVALLLSWSFDLTLNIMTMGGLVVAIGPVIDQTIVVLENSYRYTSRGHDPDEAALLGAAEVSGPVTASVLSLAAVFLPLAFVGGLTGAVFSQLALTVSFALLASLVVALTLTPVLISLFLKRQTARGEGSSAGSSTPNPDGEHAENRREGALVRFYGPILAWAVGHKGVVVAVAFGLFAGGLVMAGGLAQSFFPAQGSDTLSAQVELPEGTTLDETAQELERIEGELSDDPDVSNYLLQIGGESAGGAGNVLGGARPENVAEVTIALEEGADADEALDRIEEEADDTYGARNVALIVVSTGAASGEIEATITGGTAEERERAAELIQPEMSDNDGVKDVQSTLAGGAPQVGVELDQRRVSEVGLTPATAAASLAALFGGAEAQNGEQQATVDGRPIFVSIPEESLDSVDAVRQLTVVPGVTVGDIADVEETGSPSSVVRTDGEQATVVTGTITAEDTTRVTTAVDDSINGLDLPGGVEVAIGGEQEDVQEGFGGMFVAIVIAIVLVYLILAAFFGSVLTPLALLLSLPVVTVGAFGALLLTGTPISVPVLLGLLLLVGIVVANAVLLVDFAEKARAGGATPDEAAIEAGKVRIRPVLMTASATVGALLPLAVGLGGSGIINAALAIPVIGGLISSTLLTLLVVPAGYALVKNLSLRTRSRRGRDDGGPRGDSPDDGGPDRGPDGGPPSTAAETPEDRRQPGEEEPEKERELVGAVSQGPRGSSEGNGNGSRGSQYELGRAQGRVEFLREELRRRERELGELREGRRGGGPVR